MTKHNLKEISEQEVVVLGLCRDVANVVENDVLRLLESFQDFSKIHFRFVESDSSDLTLHVLEKIRLNVPHFQFFSFGDLEERIPDRLLRIGYCRNRCLEVLRSDKTLANCSYVVVSDLDGTNQLLTREAVMSCWKRSDWDVCMANQAAPYYDIFALRHPEWSPNDCFQYDIQLRESGLNPFVAREKAIYSRMITIPSDSDWISVDSAFGGLAIYKRELFDDVSYESNSPVGYPECEHVILHRQMKAAGARLFINPELINIGWNPHNMSKRFSKKRNRFIKLIIWILIPPLRSKLF